MIPFEEIPPPVETLILICEKCGKKLVQNEQENPSSLIQKSLKMQIKQELPPGTARAITTSCMSVCPSNAITIARVPPLKENPAAQFYILHEKDVEKAKKFIFDEFIKEG